MTKKGQSGKKTKDPAGHYSEQGFWRKVKKYAKAAGVEVIEKSLQLYYAGLRKECPAWAKAAVGVSLGYFIWPLDVIPDALPVIGFSDDLGVLTGAILTINSYINANVKRQAAAKVKDWFG
ncbi:MAG TPA: YkvA family protein [Myxococcota bacterium]|nr:YkvA family protein [Myxococcota bacterium]HRY92229.1 YkvA family protein [Myxococcota bacterium]